MADSRTPPVSRRSRLLAIRVIEVVFQDRLFDFAFVGPKPNMLLISDAASYVIAAGKLQHPP